MYPQSLASARTTDEIMPDLADCEKLGVAGFGIFALQVFVVSGACWLLTQAMAGS